MKIALKIITYLIFISTVISTVKHINDGESWWWIVLGLLAVMFWGKVCGFWNDIDKLENYINK